MNTPAQIAQCVRTGNWSELSQYFSSRLPASADEYQARALMTMHQGKGAVDWVSVVSDMRQACTLRPGDILLLVNLTQALLDSNQPKEAYKIAKHTSTVLPKNYPSMEKLALAAVATQRWAEAYSILLEANVMFGPQQPLPEQAARLLAELSPRWWEQIEKGGVVLRRPDISDAAFLSSTFGNEGFMLHYHRFQGSSDAAVENFISGTQLSPRQTRRIDWIVLDRRGTRVGLAAIVDIDWGNERGELLIGLPEDRTKMVSVKASAAVLEFAFKRLNLAKMMSYVYADNPDAQSNTLHLGFEQEGLLRSHIAGKSGRLDLFVNGMTHAGYERNVLLNRLEHRWSKQAVMD